jgi:hypothetical protein
VRLLIETSESPSTELSELSLAEIRTRLETNRRLRAMLDAEDVELFRRLETEMAVLSDTGLVRPERELMAHGGLSSRDASTVVGRAHTVAVVSGLGDVLASGATTAGHVDAVARGLKLAGADRDRFLEHAPVLVEASTRLPVGEFSSWVRDVARSVVSDGGVATFERQRRSTYFKMWDDADGMMQVRGAFDPLSGAVLRGVIDREVERMFHGGDTEVTVMPWIEPNENRAARALIDVVSNPPAEVSSARAEVIVHVELGTLTGGAGVPARTVYGSDLPVETVRRLACEAEIIPVVLDGDSVPIDVGRAKRLATAHQRRALEAVHSGCAVPDCGVRYHRCQIHHIDYWERGGPTDLDNMVPLCTKHHHLVHEGGWKLVLDPTTRAVTFGPGGPGT